MKKFETLRVVRSLDAAIDRREMSYQSLLLMQRAHEIEVEELTQIGGGRALARKKHAVLRSGFEEEIARQHDALAAIASLISIVGRGLE